MLNEHRNVIAAITQGRQLHGNDVQTVIEVLSERSLGHHLREVGIRSGDDPHVDLDRLTVADTLELALLERAQQLCLERAAHRPDFVEEERAFVRLFESSLARADRAGERAANMAEELGFQEVSGIALQFSATNRCVRRALL